MGLKKENLIINEARTRIDVKVTKTAWLGEDWTADLRIVSREPIPEGKEEELLKQIADRKGEWKPGKKNQVLSLTGINATGYILNFQIIEAGIL